MNDQKTVKHAPGQLLDLGGGRQVWIEREGAGEPVLVLSGLGPAGSHSVFHPSFSELAKTHEVIYLDLFGRGSSPRPKSLRELTFASDVADVAAAIQALGHGPLHVFGFSFGGVLAQALALEHPRLLKSVVLANTLHSPQMWQENHGNLNRELQNQFPDVWDQIVALHERGVPSTAPEMQKLFAHAFALVRFYDPDNASKLTGLYDPAARNLELYPIYCGADVDFIIGGEVPHIPDFRPRLKEIACPLMILAGRYDRALYPRLQRDFARHAPQAKFVWMEKSGSFAHVEEPEALFALLREFYAPRGA
ncbi:MAG: alpha/beta fold hydrolase [Deltaproteobacteria bacterium]|nr:alpha/beta fold hydrolase [Deltaproteobacteria bacterium]